MTPEQILKIPSRVLTRAQRESYFDNGYLLLESIITPDVVEEMRAVTAEWVEKSRSISKSDAVFDLEPGHAADNPRLRRLSSPVEHDDRYWKFASESIIPDIIADLVGPDVKFHHSKLNFKWAEGGEEVKWHQDIQYWPHTNYSPLTIGTYLHDVGPDQGPLGVVPGSHKGDLFDEYNDKGQLGRMPFRPRSPAGAPRHGGVPHGTIRFDHDPQLPDDSRVMSEPLRSGSSASSERLFRGGRVYLYRKPVAQPIRRNHRARPPGALRVPRPTAVPGSSGLVRRVHVAVRPPAGRGLGRGSACGGCGADPGHPASRSRRRVVAGGTRGHLPGESRADPVATGAGFYAPVFPVRAFTNQSGRSVTIASAPDERNDSISSDWRNVQILVAIPSSRACANRSGLMSR